MLLFRWAMMLLLIAAGVSFAFYVGTGQARFKRFGLLLLTGMERTDTLENLANQRGLGRINKAVISVPPRQCGQPMAQCAGRKLATVVGQIAGNRIGGCRQETSPFDLEVPQGRLVAQTGVLPLGGFKVLVEAAHQRQGYDKTTSEQTAPDL